MSRIHGLNRICTWHNNVEGEHPEERECFCGRIFYSEKEFRDHLSTYGAQT